MENDKFYILGHVILPFRLMSVSYPKHCKKDLKNLTPTLALPEAVEKSIWFFVTSFRRKPESSVFKTLRTCWTPVFTGVTAEI